MRTAHQEPSCRFLYHDLSTGLPNLIRNPRSSAEIRRRDPLTHLTPSHRAAAQTASRPRSHSPGARPIASWHDRILPLFWKIIFLFPGHRSPALEDISDPCRELRVYAVPCARTAGIRSRLPVLPHGVRPYGRVFGLPDLAPFRRPLPFPWVLFRLLLAFDHLPISSPTNRNILNLLVDDRFRDSTPLV